MGLSRNRENVELLVITFCKSQNASVFHVYPFVVGTLNEKFDTCLCYSYISIVIKHVLSFIVIV